MIILTRLGGHELAVNPDLIERAEPTPDTVLTMIDGHKIVVAESVEEVVTSIRAWRATIVAKAYGLSCSPDRNPLAQPDEDHQRDAVGDHAALDASMARVLRLPQRGE